MKKLFVFAVAALAMAACSSNDEGTNANVPKNDKIELTTGVTTRATSQTLQATQVANGQYVWINFTTDCAATAINQTGASSSAAVGSSYWNTDNTTPAANVQQASAVYVANGSGNLSSTTLPVKWPKTAATAGAEIVNIEAWAPVASTATGPLTNFTVQADQTTEANYLASDYIYGTKTGVAFADISSPVMVKFDHMLAKINVNLFAIDPTIVLEGSKVEFCTDVINSGTPAGASPLCLKGDITSGAISVDNTGAKGAITMTSYLETACTCSAIIIPQSLSATSTATIELFKVTLPDGTTTKTYELTVPKNFEAKKEYTYNITISDGQTLVLSEQINDWTVATPESVIAN